MPKYRAFPKVDLPDRTWPENSITNAPIWCSVDLRDGNQALAEPMGIETKLKMFKLLVEIGFKEIEVGFPSASQIEFDFIRRLIEENHVPDGVSLQVLTQAREHLIRRTFESLRGAKRAILHLYNSTSALQRKVTFGMTKAQIKEIAIQGTKLVKSLVDTVPDTKITLEYSPESFSDTEPAFAVEVCDAVVDAWEPAPGEKVILNLPNTVEWMTPNIHADQIEYFIRNLRNRSHAIISLHTHNDRGTGVAATELGLLAGAERVEGTLFGNGERTGNLDLVTVALNMFSQGVDPELELSNVPSIRSRYETYTGMEVHPRHPYAGDLVFTAFSGSHQDAIKKGMDLREANRAGSDAPWEVPYLPIDPKDIGRTYEAIIRINSQSGKGGVAYIMSRSFGYELPKAMHPEFGKVVNAAADARGKELSTDEIFSIFTAEYLEADSPLSLAAFDTNIQKPGGATVKCRAKVRYERQTVEITGIGNGPIDAFVHAMRENGWNDFRLTEFTEQAVGTGSGTEAAAYVQIETGSGARFWGVGKDTDITVAGLKALISAYNRAVKACAVAAPQPSLAGSADR